MINLADYHSLIKSHAGLIIKTDSYHHSFIQIYHKGRIINFRLFNDANALRNLWSYSLKLALY